MNKALCIISLILITLIILVGLNLASIWYIIAFYPNYGKSVMDANPQLNLITSYKENLVWLSIIILVAIMVQLLWEPSKSE